MWPFLKRQQSSDTASGPDDPAQQPRPRPLEFAQLIAGMGDFSELKTHDSALKFWLPEPAAAALREVTDRNGDSLSSMLRQFFAHHCYGIYAFHVMTDAIPGLFNDPVVRFSRGPAKEVPGKVRVDTYWVPELGKNIVPIKVWIPARLRRDLQTLADHVGVTLSQYAREIVISRLLGHGTLPCRPEMLTAAPLPAADAWCEGRDVAKRKATFVEYANHAESECRTEWVDARVE